MDGQLTNLLVIWAMLFSTVAYLLYRAHAIEKEELKRKAKREAQRRREMAVVGARVRRQLTIERFDGTPRRRQPVRKFCGVLATFENQNIVK